MPSPAGPLASPPSVGGNVGVLVDAQITGRLIAVSVDSGRFIMREAAKTHEIQVAPETLIYAGNQQIPFKRMAAYVGSHLTVWLTTDAVQQLANRVILTVLPASGGTTGDAMDRASGGGDLHSGGNSGSSGHTAHH